MTVVPIYVIILYRGKGRAFSESSSNVVPEVIEMKPDNKANVYVAANMFTWIILCAIAITLIVYFISRWILSNVLSIAAVIGLAYFEERIVSRVVNRIVAFFLHE